MLVQDYLRDLKAVSGDWLPSLKFLIMFIGAVVGPLVLLVVGGSDSKTLSEDGLAWSFLAIALLLLMGAGAGFSMFGRGARFLSISPKRI
jgi:hypothetical protein